jgi:L-fuculose-phosphate aldolase
VSEVRWVKTEHAIRREVIDTAHLLWDRGWVANHDGNVTAHAAPGRMVATATALSKRAVAPENLIVVDENAKVVQGRQRVFSEIGLHLTVYRRRPDARCVIHAHPPHATALACAGKSLPCFLPEAVVSLGREVPLVAFGMPGTEAEGRLADHLETHDAVLLENHGVLTWGDDCEQAFLRMELVEHLAQIAHLACTHGGIRTLPEAQIAKLLESRKKAGLGPEGRAARRTKLRAG